MKIFAPALLLLFIALHSFAQDKKGNDTTTIKPSYIRTPVLPYYSFKKGIGITSPDSIYQLNIRFRMQNRATYNLNDNNVSSMDFQVRRLRLRFDGYVGSPKFQYTIQLGFAPGDLGGTVTANENLKIIRDAVIWYQPNARWNFGFGQTKLPGNRQRLNSSGALQLTDRSINNAEFTIDRDFGVQIHQLNMHKDHFSYNFKASLSQGEGRMFAKNDDLGLCYTGKIELYPFGAFSSGGEYFEGDLKRETSPKLMISGAYSFNNKAKLSNGQLGNQLYEKKDLHGIFGDLILKYKGFAFMTAYMARNTANPVTMDVTSNNIRYVYAGQGIDFQTSYITKSFFEFIFRYSYQKVNTKIHNYAPNISQYSVGVTKYFWEHQFKVQLELTYENKYYINNMVRDNFYARFQVEIGI